MAVQLRVTYDDGAFYYTGPTTEFDLSVLQPGMVLRLEVERVSLLTAWAQRTHNPDATLTFVDTLFRLIPSNQKLQRIKVIRDLAYTMNVSLSLKDAKDIVEDL